MIIYALQDDRVSAGALFMAGLVPGLLIAVAMMIVTATKSRSANPINAARSAVWPHQPHAPERSSKREIAA